MSFNHRPLVLIVILFLLGMLLARAWFLPEPVVPEKLQWLEGTIVSEPQTKDRLTSFVFSTKRFGLVQMAVFDCEKNLRYGALLRAPTRLEVYPPATNPLLSSYGEYQLTKKILYRTSLSCTKLKVQPGNRGNPLVKLAITVKNSLIPVLRKTMPLPYSDLMGSLIFGTTAAPLSNEIKDTYKRAGVIHLLVVSGSQIALLVGVCLRLCQSLRLSNLLTFMVVTFCNLLFTLMTGADPSITRAAIMAEIALVGRLLGRDNDVYTTMALAALISTLINPFTLFNVGFQLSFAATWALVYVAPILEDNWKKKISAKIAAPLAISIAPFLTTLPLTVYYFSGLSLVSLPLNILVLSWVEILVTTGFLATLLGWLWLPLGIIINGFNYVLLVILHWLTTLFASIPYAYLYIKAIPVWVVIIYYALLVLWLEGQKRVGQSVAAHQKRDNYPTTTLLKKHWLGALALGGIFLLLNLGGLSAWPLTITMIDVGQGDSILLEIKNGPKVLIDAGDSQAGTYRVLPFLRRKGINQLDVLVLTHEHADHIGGAAAILKGVAVTGVMVQPLAPDHQLGWHTREYRQTIKKKKIPLKIARAGQIIKLNAEVTLFVLHPGKDPLKGTSSDLNENSIVLLLTYRHFRLLLMGDAGLVAEEEMLKKYQTSLLQADILKVGHHGSRTASGEHFISAVRPRQALISCGADNRFKHPHQSVLTRLQTFAIQSFRTDQVGAITIQTDGKHWRLKTFLKK